MKFLALLLLLPTLSFADELKILSWNVFMLAKPIKFSMQRERAPLIAKALQTSGADIILLQEAFTRAFRDHLRKVLATEYPYSESLPQGGLMVLSRYPLKPLKAILFSKCAWADCMADKGATISEVHLPSGKKLQIGTTHLQAGNFPNIRLSQLSQSHKLYQELAQTNVPQIFGGDFNIDANTGEEFRILISQMGMGPTRLSSELRVSNAVNIRCFDTRGGDTRNQHIDHLLLNPRGSTAKFSLMMITVYTSLLGNEKCDLSDHHAIMGTLTL
jgi:endonuclease/exonuclease/phosphatase family metal-dependent hydrolase